MSDDDNQPTPEEVDSFRSLLASHGLSNLAGRSDEELVAMLRAMRLADDFEQHPKANPKCNAAFLAARKWAIKTAKLHGVDAIPVRLKQAAASQTRYDESELTYYHLGAVAAFEALSDGREPPLSWVTIQ